jgi:hypothetical protein
MVIALHTRYLGLLEHELRDDHSIGITGAPPGEIPPVATEPAKQPAAEIGDVQRWPWHAQKVAPTRPSHR